MTRDNSENITRLLGDGLSGKFANLLRVHRFRKLLVLKIIKIAQIRGSMGFNKILGGLPDFANPRYFSPQGAVKLC